MYELLGYLTQVNQSNRVMTLYGVSDDEQQFKFLAKHEYHPNLPLPLKVPNRPLKDGELVKIPGYVCPFRVNLYEYARCCNK